MAAAYYNYFTHSHDADFAGTEVELPGETLLEHHSGCARCHFKRMLSL
jgi:hypothetical protein